MRDRKRKRERGKRELASRGETKRGGGLDEYEYGYGGRCGWEHEERVA